MQRRAGAHVRNLANIEGAVLKTPEHSVAEGPFDRHPPPRSLPQLAMAKGSCQKLEHLHADLGVGQHAVRRSATANGQRPTRPK